MATGEALVCKLKNISPIEGADRIVQANLFGETVIVSKEYQEGQLGLLFDCETQLSEKFAHENNLYRHSEYNKDINKIGYLEDNRRVRAIKLRGLKCSAMFMPIESLNFISNKYPAEGLQINEWCGVPICHKYMRPVRGPSLHKKKIKQTQQVFHFQEHFDTDQLLRNLHRIKVGTKLVVTSKLHGTSCRVGLLPCTSRNIWGRLLDKIFNRKLEYRMVVGSRHVLKGVEGQEIDKNGSYYQDNVWLISANEHFKDKLVKGETIFYEIVGFLPNGTPIMPSNSNQKLKNFLEKDEYNAFINKYGEETEFNYGCRHGHDIEGPFGEYKIFVYRITLTTENGATIDLSWEQVKRRCEEMGVPHVPEILEPRIIDKNHIQFFQDEQNWINLTEQDCKYFPQHLNEGICVRLEGNSLQPEIYKSKRFAFKVLEGIIRDNSEFADMEESN